MPSSASEPIDPGVSLLEQPHNAPQATATRAKARTLTGIIDKVHPPARG